MNEIELKDRIAKLENELAAAKEQMVALRLKLDRVCVCSCGEEGCDNDEA